VVWIEVYVYVYVDVYMDVGRGRREMREIKEEG
jgi:hypothetical protein